MSRVVISLVFFGPGCGVSLRSPRSQYGPYRSAQPPCDASVPAPPPAEGLLACATRLVAVKSVEPTRQWDTDRLFTVPNILSFARLLAVPVFGWLIVAGHDMAAVLLLAASGATDWLDGFLARALRQTSELGARLDPIADRLYILTALMTLTIRGIVPWWFLVILVARDAMLVGLLPSLRRSGRLALSVNIVGKAGTMLLLVSFPLILVGSSSSLGVDWATLIGWLLAAGGAVAYWVAGIDYVVRTVRLARARETG